MSAKSIFKLREVFGLVKQGEGPAVEFKRSTGELKEAMRSLCAFLNGSGGSVLFGIRPNGGIEGQDVSDVFHRAGLIERWGRGTNRVITMCRAAGVRPPEFAEVGPSSVVTFRVNVAGEGLTSEQNSENGSEKSSEKSSEKILSFLVTRKTASATEIAAIMGLTSRAVEKQIALLKASGRLRRVGPDKGGYWEVMS